MLDSKHEQPEKKQTVRRVSSPIYKPRAGPEGQQCPNSIFELRPISIFRTFFLKTQILTMQSTSKALRNKFELNFKFDFQKNDAKDFFANFPHFC